MTSGVRRALLLVGALAGLGAAGFAGQRAWRDHACADAVAHGTALLDAGHLHDAKGVAESLRTDFPDRLDGYVLGLWALRALHDRPGALALLQQGYELHPGGFPLLAEYIDHRLSGPDDPAKAYDALALLDTHAKLYPADAHAVAESRLVALAYLLGQKNLAPDRRAEAVRMAEAALIAFPASGAATTAEHYDRAQTLLALGHYDDAIAEARAGIAAGTNKWDAVVMQWAVAALELHHGKDDAAWADIGVLHGSIDDWPGTHFGMGKPLVEFVQITALARWGRTVDPPPDYAARLGRLDAEGVHLQYGDDDMRKLLQQLLAALQAKDDAAALPMVDNALKLLARDRGCQMENQIIRPNAVAMLDVIKGDLLSAADDASGARSAYLAAQALFPDDAWLAGKVLEAVQE